MIAITEKEIKKIMHLIKLNFTSENVLMHKQHLVDVMEFIAPIFEVETKNVKPMSQVWNFELRLRSDNVMENEQQEALQKNAARAAAGFYLVPKVIETKEIKN